MQEYLSFQADFTIRTASERDGFLNNSQYALPVHTLLIISKKTHFDDLITFRNYDSLQATSKLRGAQAWRLEYCDQVASSWVRKKEAMSLRIQELVRLFNKLRKLSAQGWGADLIQRLLGLAAVVEWWSIDASKCPNWTFGTYLWHK